MTLRTSSDSQVAVSRVAVERAMAWYAQEVTLARSPPVAGPAFRALRESLSGAAPWRDEQFDDLMTFGRAMFRLAGQVPDCNVGDLLTVLAARAQPAGAVSWRFDPQVDGEAFAKLAFRETSLGISGAQRENREGWWAHGQKNRAFIEQAVAGCARRELAVVLGAGRAYDLPLALLAGSFERLVLVDIDGAALDETVAATFKDAGLRARVATRVVDLTGVNGVLVRRLDEILEGAGTADEAEAQVAALCRSYRLEQPPRLLEGERPDLLVESCVLTQLAWPQRVYAEQRFDTRFGPMGQAREMRWSTAWAELGLRIQQDHINALAGTAGRVVLTSDVVSHTTSLDPSGAERRTGRQSLPLGVESLRERVPKAFRIGAHAAWEWHRYRPVKRREGARMDVEGVDLSEPVTAGGLWLPPG